MFQRQAQGSAVAAPGKVELFLLGVAQDAGVPQTGCHCSTCTDVRAGRLPRLHPASAALIDHAAGKAWLLDCSPHFGEQLEMLQVHAPGVKLEGVLLTHMHYGHYTGLYQFGKEVMDWKGLQVWGTASVCSFLRSNQPWATFLSSGNIVLQELAPGVPVPLGGCSTLQITPQLVPHRAEYSDAVCFIVQGPTARILYLPDIDSWWQWEEWGTKLVDAVRAVDWAFLDATFFAADELPHGDYKNVPHPLVTTTAEVLQGSGLESRVVLFHLNHTNALLRPGSDAAEFCLKRGLKVGRQGAVYAL